MIIDILYCGSVCIDIFNNSEILIRKPDEEGNIFFYSDNILVKIFFTKLVTEMT